MKCGHLFNGIGGFALASHWMGWENVMHCEIDPFCNRVMNYHFPNSFQHEDIRTTDFSIYRGKIELLTGGFPCKQTSIGAAIHGKRSGLKGPDSGLWHEELRTFAQAKARWVIVENPSGVKKWETEIQESLADIGYTVSRLEFKASSFGLPHQRRRYLYVGNSHGERLEISRQSDSLTTEWYTRLAANRGSWLASSPGIIGSFNGLPNRVDRIKALGNAIVPQVAYQIFKAIDQYEKLIR
jgi:DNA (cytosine-5)-methyltransferase 1